MSDLTDIEPDTAGAASTAADDGPTAEPTAEPVDDLPVIIPGSQQVTLRCGITVEVREVATLELFQLLKILTKGLSSNPDALAALDPDAGDGAFAKQLLMMLLAAVGDAGPETVAFLRMCVEPTGLLKGKLIKPELAANKAAIDALDEAMANPPLADTMALVKAIFTTNLPHLAELGKELAGLIQMARRTGQIPNLRTSQD